jgi:hypothetical protein
MNLLAAQADVLPVGLRHRRQLRDGQVDKAEHRN